MRAKDVLKGIGNEEKIFHAGPDGAGQVAKAANNMLLAIHMIGTCEALALGAANGLDPAVQSEIMKASSGNNWSLQVYNPWPGVMEGAPAGNDYKPGFMVDLMAKDLGLANELAEQSYWTRISVSARVMCIGRFRSKVSEETTSRSS